MAPHNPAGHPGDSSPELRFPAALTRARSRRQMSMRALAKAMGFDPSYVSHVEASRYPASADFVRKAEQVLAAEGQLWNAWQAENPAAPPQTVASRGTTGLIVELDHADLRYDGTRYHAAMRRTIVNTGPAPVTRYLIRISVDRHPGNVEASNQLYRSNPLTFDELNLTATCDGEPMDWQPKLDRDSFKEIWLRFGNEHGRFPLYPGQRATLDYAYTVGDDKWGHWFQRAVRLPTLALSVKLAFPTDLSAAVWGSETSTTAEAVTLHAPITHHVDADKGEDVFEWATGDPPLNSRYRLEWRFRGRTDDTGADSDQAPDLRLASDRMKAAGIVQQGDPILTQPAELFDLPAEADRARDLIDMLLAAMQRVREHHVFGKGMGLAAPQIGIGRAAALVQPPGDDANPLVLLNPTIVVSSPDTDEQYEGCLSFFDVRGLVPRPRRIEVEHTALDGSTTITIFTDALARLVGHEIDHLNGHLYLDLMRPNVHPIPVETYKGTGHAWRYQ
ncbi:peptide deformylase [Spirillospora sp. NPDC047279]|uniref:peptide deformylase n=1 Tax=Spirillospora sp. NPDC047279 TaxID=3155478 RepID=UPI00340414B2